MSNSIMIDLETMGSGNNAAIVAIGAVRFDKDAIQDTFYQKVDLGSSVTMGLDIDPSTVLWWLKQSDEARAEITSNNTVHINNALMDLVQWMLDSDYDPIVWGNGSDFDNVILNNAFDKACLVTPWKFWNNRCYRTVKNIYKDIELIRSGTHHNALDDAKTQALHLIRIANVKGFEI